MGIQPRDVGTEQGPSFADLPALYDARIESLHAKGVPIRGRRMPRAERRAARLTRLVAEVKALRARVEELLAENLALVSRGHGGQDG